MLEVGRASCNVPRLGTSRQVLRRHRPRTRSSRCLAEVSKSPTTSSSNTVSVLYNLQNGAEIHLVGTAHISKASADEVRDTILSVKPATVFLELDEDRAQKVMKSDKEMRHFGFQDFAGQLVSSFGLKLPQLMFKLMLSRMRKSLESMGVQSGLEFRVAIEEAQKLNAKLVYGDQHSDDTLQNLQDSLSITDLYKFLTQKEEHDDKIEEAANKSMMAGQSAGLSGFLESVEELKSRKNVTDYAATVRKFSPKMAKVLIDDRDEKMVQALRGLEGRVVGVVGIGHLDGMERLWQQLDEQQNQQQSGQQQQQQQQQRQFSKVS